MKFSRAFFQPVRRKALKTLIFKRFVHGGKAKSLPFRYFFEKYSYILYSCKIHMPGFPRELGYFQRLSEMFKSNALNQSEILTKCDFCNTVFPSLTLMVAQLVTVIDNCSYCIAFKKSSSSRSISQQFRNSWLDIFEEKVVYSQK